MKHLSTLRIIVVKVFQYENKYFFKISEIANVLGVKQQYQLTADIKKMFGEDVVKKGIATEGFRGIEDTDRTTFISSNHLREYLNSDKIYHKIIEDKKIELLNELRRF